MEKSSLQKTKVLVAPMAAAIAFLADIYVIIHMPRNYPILGVVSLVFLVSLYLGISGRIRWKELERLRWEEQYQDMIRAEKACYFLIRKNFREINGRVNTLDIKIDPLAEAGEINHKKISSLLDTLMQEQKKIAKITVSRNKENANAMMNSNDKVIEKMFEMQDGMSRISEAFENQPEDRSQEEFAKVKENQQQLAEKVQGIEENLNRQMELLMEKLEEISIAAAKREVVTQMVQQPVQELTPESVLQEERTDEEALSEKLLESLTAEPMLEEPIEPLVDELALEDETVPLADEIALEDEVIPLADELMPEETQVKEEPAGGMMTPEEIAALIAEDSKQPAPEPIEPWIPPIEDEIAPTDDMPPLEQAVPEPKVKAEAPDLSNPNKMMSPEEIAALIAGTETEEFPAAPEAVVETPEPEVKTEAPDLSNPNKMMSPEDIAALIANM